MKGILGTKVGMTQIFNEQGVLIPVTVVKVEKNVITQIKTKENEGYDAIQVGSVDILNKKGEVKKSVVNKPQLGHFEKSSQTPKRFLKEFLVENTADYKVGQEFDASLFVQGEIVDVSATSKGKGFQGVIKRHNQSRGPMSHGSRYHRRPGSMGAVAPVVFKGKKLPGQMGNKKVTLQNLEVVQVKPEMNVILIKGNVPGPKRGLVEIRSSFKKTK